MEDEKEGAGKFFIDRNIESSNGLAPCSVRQNEEILINKIAGRNTAPFDVSNSTMQGLHLLFQYDRKF